MPTSIPTPEPTKHLRLGKSGNDLLQREVIIAFPKGAHFRIVSAALCKLAAEVELSTAGHERWVVQIEHGQDTSCRVYLELANAPAIEAERGMVVLRAVAGT